ncbi:MAG: hypothetical protein ACUVTD_08140 [Nitrososphaerales archaeon]
MAKYKVVYPAAAVTKYKTTRVAPSEQTYGKRKMTGFTNRPYYKPSLRKVIMRHPGVLRRSADVLAINAVLKGLAGKPEHPSYKCGGLAWPERIACLKREMAAVIKPVAEVLG